MTIQELIDKLNLIENKNIPVVSHTGEDGELMEVEEVDVLTFNKQGFWFTNFIGETVENLKDGDKFLCV